MIIYSVDGQIILNPSQSPVPSFLGSCVPEDPRMSLIAQQTWKILELQVSIFNVCSLDLRTFIGVSVT